MSDLADKYMLLFRQLNSGAVSILPPVANFSSVITNLSVAFTDTSTNTPTSWSWDFGDGSAVSTLQNPTHVYAGHGTYSVVLTATNAGGSDASDPQNVAVNTRFHAAVITAGAQWFYDHQDPTGATNAANSGSSIGNGTYTSVTLEQTDITGTKDAGLYNADSDQLAWPAGIFFQAFTMGFLLDAVGAIGTNKQIVAASGDGLFTLDLGVGGAIQASLDTEFFSSTATYQTNVGVFTNAPTVLFVDFDPDTGELSISLSTDGTVTTPTPVINVPATIGEFAGSMSSFVTKGNLGASGGLVGGAFMKETLLSGAQKTAIAAAAFNV